MCVTLQGQQPVPSKLGVFQAPCYMLLAAPVEQCTVSRLPLVSLQGTGVAPCLATAMHHRISMTIVRCGWM